jgi:hypothetical protein
MIACSSILDRVGLAPKQRIAAGRRSGLSRGQGMFAALGDWVSALNLPQREVLSRDGPERVYRFCQDCGDDARHEGYDELGVGWYAQVFCCRGCGRQGVRVWSLF